MPALRSGAAVRVAAILALAVAYVAAARLGLSVAYAAPQVTAVWPPTALSLAMLLLGGVRLWPGVWLGAFVANLTAEAPLPATFGIAAGNTLEALLGAWLLRRHGLDLRLERLRDVVLLAVTAATVPCLSATVGVTSLVASSAQPPAAAAQLWLTWWLGDAMSVLLFAPALLTWGAELPGLPRLRRPLEAAVLLASVAGASYCVFGERFSTVAVHYSLAYVVFPFLLAVSVRSGQQLASVAVLSVAAIAVRGTALGYGPFRTGNPGQSIELLQAYLGVLAITGLLLAAATAERRTEERRRAADYAIVAALAESASLEEAAPRILSSICESLEWDVGLLWGLDAEAGTLRMIEVRSRPGVQVAAFADESRRRVFASGQGLPGRV